MRATTRALEVALLGRMRTRGGLEDSAGRECSEQVVGVVVMASCLLEAVAAFEAPLVALVLAIDFSYCD